MDESHRSSPASTRGDQAGTPPTDPSSGRSPGNPAGYPHASAGPSDASSPWAAPQAPAAPLPLPTGPDTAGPAYPGAPHSGVPHSDTPHPGTPHAGTPHPGAPHPGAAHPGAAHPGTPYGGGFPPAGEPHQTGPFPVWSVSASGHPAAPIDTLPRPTRRRGPVAVAIAGGALVIALVAGGTGAAVGVAVNDSSGTGVTISRESSNATTQTSDASTVESAAATALKSVVTIEVTALGGAGTGSGVVLDSSGHILTNNHVVEEAANNATISVTLPNGTPRSATIVGRDPSSDIAVIKVSDTSGLTPATFAASSTVKTGQTVLAIGAPLGLSNTVTQGIVSALNRPVRTSSDASQNTVIDAVQTDAAINPGNSGGALADLSGRVIGINSAIATVSSGSSGFGQQESQSGNIGVGFAIPADTALNVAKQLIEDGTAEHATLGVSAQDTQNGTGAQIVQVTSGSAADDAGLKTGDVVTAVGDRRVTDTDGLVAAVRSHNPDERVRVTYQRGGTTDTVTAKLSSSAT